MLEPFGVINNIGFTNALKLIIFFEWSMYYITSVLVLSLYKISWTVYLKSYFGCSTAWSGKKRFERLV